MSQIVSELDVPGIGKCVALSSLLERSGPNINRLRARLITEAILLNAVKEWARKLNLVGNGQVILRDEKITPPKVGTFAWDLTAPSYLFPFIKRSKDKVFPGFVVCDVLLGSDVTESGIQPFLHKCNTLRILKNITPCLQIFVADNYTFQAFKNAKNAKIIPATPGTLFGNEVAKGLKQLMDVLTQTALASSDPKVLTEVFNSLGKIEGTSAHLRGSLFEFIIADLVGKTISATITMNGVYANDRGEKAEVDLLAVEAKRTVNFIECKGYNPMSFVPDEEVERWLTKRILILRDVALKHPDWKNLEYNFEFWTTGKLSDKAVTMIHKAISSTKKYTIKYLDNEAIREYAKRAKDKNLINLLNEHFLNTQSSVALLSSRSNKKK